MANYGRDYQRNQFNRFGGSGYDYGFGGGPEGYGRWNSARNRGWDETDRDRFGSGRGTGWGQQHADDRWQRSTQGWGRNFDDDWGTSQRYHRGTGYGNQGYGNQSYGNQDYGSQGFGRQGFGRQDYGSDYGDRGFGGGQGFSGQRFGYGNQMGGSFDRGDDRSFYGGDRERHMSEYDQDFGQKIRRGWNRLRDEARDWMGRGYDRGW